MFRSLMLAIFRLYINLPSSYTTDTTYTKINMYTLLVSLVKKTKVPLETLVKYTCQF